MFSRSAFSAWVVVSSAAVSCDGSDGGGGGGGGGGSKAVLAAVVMATVAVAMVVAYGRWRGYRWRCRGAAAVAAAAATAGQRGKAGAPGREPNVKYFFTVGPSARRQPPALPGSRHTTYLSCSALRRRLHLRGGSFLRRSFHRCFVHDVGHGKQLRGGAPEAVARVRRETPSGMKGGLHERTFH